MPICTWKYINMKLLDFYIDYQPMLEVLYGSIVDI